MSTLLETLKSIDNSILLFINGKHTPFWDSFMLIMSNRFTWIPLYVFLAFLIYKKFGRQAWIVILFAVLAIAMSDQLSSHLVKNLVMRYRPSHNLMLSHQLHIVDDYRGGLYGFASSHAANTFSLSVFILLLMPQSRILITCMFLWAVIVCYSRMYLGVHYPSDIIGGSLIGALSAWIAYKLYLVIKKRLSLT